MFARKKVSGRGLFARGLSLTAAVLMLGTLAACSGGGEPSSTASGTNPSSKYGEIELPDMNVTNSKLRMLQPDETLAMVAERFRTTPGRLMRLNPTLLPTDFSSGTIICVP